MAGNDLTIYGVTTDGFVAYYDHVHSTIDVVSVNGGTPTQITATPGSNFAIFPQEQAVLVWTGLDGENVGSLLVWTNLDGVHALSTSSGAPNAVVDATSRYVMYENNVNETAATVAVYGALTDGSSATPLISGVAWPDDGIATVGNYAVLSYALAGAVTVSSYTLETWAATILTSSIVPGTTTVAGFDSAGTKALILNASNSLDIFPIASATPTLIAAGVTTATTGSSAILSTSGNTVFYAGGGGTTIDRSTTTTPSSTVLSNGTDLSLYAVSPNEATLLAYGGATPPSNVYFESASTFGGSPTVLTPATGFGGALYTNDSSHILYISNYSDTTGIGTLSSFSTSAGTSSTLSTTFATYSPYDSSKIVFTDNVVANTAEIKVLDTAGTAAPTVIATAVQSFTASSSVPTVGWGLATTGATTSIVYFGTAQGTRAAGIYVTPLP